jgi:hypothetical protein
MLLQLEVCRIERQTMTIRSGFFLANVSFECLG